MTLFEPVLVSTPREDKSDKKVPTFSPDSYICLPSIIVGLTH